MLEQIFGSKTRVQIITLFIRNPDKGFYIREISRITGQYINAIRRELDNLEKFGLLTTELSNKRKFYFTNPTFFLYQEIRDLFVKSKVFLENDLTNALKTIGDVKMLVFSGAFTRAETPVDILIVAEGVNQEMLHSTLEKFGTSVGQEVRYTILDTKEYLYRKEISDKFLEDIFSNKNIVLVDKI